MKSEDDKLSVNLNGIRSQQRRWTNFRNEMESISRGKCKIRSSVRRYAPRNISTL